ncbi:hypothetical protein [Archangium sp.]|uniref:hypothetical protein n=1 Tax=Archangium sp. TaxID=1872627 RepID=UPI002D62FE08|nr:hypothetical protein [Archangium sp.]HYO51177.1 hypothetical protein [Archangium sp.]
MRLTNQNPEILALLATDPWHTSGMAIASSTKPGGFIARTASVQFTSPVEFNFKMLVEASAGGNNGVVYNLTASARTKPARHNPPHSSTLGYPAISTRTADV